MPGCRSASETRSATWHVMNRLGISQGGQEDGRGWLDSRRARCFEMAVGVALGILGCGSSDRGQGVGDAGGETDSTMNDARADVGMTFDQSKCGSCLEHKCVQQFNECRQAPPCSTFLACWEQCPVSAQDIGNATCAKGCLQGDGLSADPACQGVDDCVDRQWSGDCQAECTH
jgi:hypothetical protein